jgi:hypothetical protein
MSPFAVTLIGFFFGFFFGAGCALALMYAIYSGGYRKALEDSMKEAKSDAYRRWMPYVEKRLRKERERRAADTGTLRP